MKLINGNDILNKFNLQPGKKIGALLEQVAEAQVRGEINTKEDAETFVDHILTNTEDQENL